jgi:hypothetical protein
MQRLDVMISLLEKGRFESLRLNADPHLGRRIEARPLRSFFTRS